MKCKLIIYYVLLVLFTGCGEKGQQLTVNYSNAIKESRRLVDSLFNTGRTPGLDIAVSIHGTLVWSEAYGFADLEHEVPVIPGVTRFRIGSVSKPITAAALGKLMDRGDIDIDEAVQTYVPGFPLKEYPLTIKQVSGHIGGIRHYKNQEFLLSKHYNTVLEGLDIFKDDSLLFEPGSSFSYSSYGFNLLSAAIGGASGQNFLDFMQEQVFDPLGMSSTCADMNDSIIIHRSSFYELKDDSTFVNAAYVDNSYKWAGGGFISTTTDLLKFGEAHMHPGFLSEATLNTLTTPQVLSGGDTTNYGLGWFIDESNGIKRIGHGGGSIGGITDLQVYPEKELVIAAVSNSSDTRFGNVINRIASAFIEAGE